MGFLDRFRGKKRQDVQEGTEKKDEPASTDQERRIKRYTSEGKPVYD